MANALVKGGLPAAEVTFRTAAAADCIREMSEKCPDILVGAGTVVNLEQCKRAVEAGAKFIVSPGYDDAIIDYCLENKVNLIVKPALFADGDFSKVEEMTAEAAAVVKKVRG